MSDPSSRPSPSTADALVDAGIRLFGDKGFAATSTRELAGAAKANVAAIAYHFGSKEGLREACGREAARRLTQDVAGAVASRLDAALATGMTQAEAEAHLLALVRRLAPVLMARADIDPLARFVLREQTEMSSAFQTIHDAVMAPMHERLCRLWSAATGASATSVETKISTLTVIAQIFYFRIARNVALKRMKWRRIGPAEARAISDVIEANLRAALVAARAGQARARENGA